MSADQFALAGTPGRPQPIDSGVERVELAAGRALRACGEARFDLAAGYYGSDSPQARQALEKLRALGDSPHARSELVPATREVGALSQDEMLDRLRRADPATRRQQAAPDPVFVQQIVDGIMRELPPGRRA